MGWGKNKDLHRDWDKGDYKSPLTKIRIANPNQPGGFECANHIAQRFSRF